MLYPPELLAHTLRTLPVGPQQTTDRGADVKLTRSASATGPPPRPRQDRRQESEAKRAAEQGQPEDSKDRRSCEDRLGEEGERHAESCQRADQGVSEQHAPGPGRTPVPGLDATEEAPKAFMAAKLVSNTQSTWLLPTSAAASTGEATKGTCMWN